MTEEPSEPLFMHNEPGPRFAIKTLAHALCSAGVPYSTSHARVAGYAKKNLIYVREKGVATQPNMYAASDMAAALLLSSLQDLGIADQEVHQVASLACYAWTESAPEGASVHPIHHVLHAAQHGHSTVFNLDVFRNLETNERHFRAYFSNASQMEPIGDPIEVPPSWVPMAGVVVVLDNHLQPVLRAVHDATYGQRKN